MTDSDTKADRSARIDTLERRLDAIEARNEELEAALEGGPAVTRRRTLAGLLGGGALLGGMGAASADPDDGEGNGNGNGNGKGNGGPPAKKDHDHSGDYLGEESPVDRIDVTDLVSGETPFFDVRAYGVVGDGETDDTAALQRAVDAATEANGTLYIPGSLQVRITDVVQAQGSGRRGADSYFTFLGEGAITPEKGATLEFFEFNFAELFVRVVGGEGEVEPPEDTADRITRSEDNAVRFYENDFTNISVSGKDYPGTLLQMDAGRGGGSRFGSLSTCGVEQLFSDTCGRALYLGPGPNFGPFGFNFGLEQVSEVWEYESDRNLTAEFVNDLTIDYYENFEGEKTTKGLRFDFCNALLIGTLTIGGDATVPLARFYECSGINIDKAFSPASGSDPFVFDSCREGYANIVVGDAGQRSNGEEGGAAVRIDQTTDAPTDFRPTTALTFNVTAQNAARQGIHVTENVDRGDAEHWINLAGGEIRNCGNGGDYPGIEIGTKRAVTLSTFRGIDNPNADLKVVENNDTHVLDCRLPEVAGEPATDRQL